MTNGSSSTRIKMREGKVYKIPNDVVLPGRAVKGLLQDFEILILACRELGVYDIADQLVDLGKKLKRIQAEQKRKPVVPNPVPYFKD